MGKHFFKNLGKTFKKTGNWFKHAGEDTFKWGENTVGKVGNRLLDFADNQTSKISDVLTNPTLLLIAGGVVVVLIMMRSR